MGPTFLDHGHPLTLGVDASGTAAHFLEGLPIRNGTLVEVRLGARSSIFAAQDTWLPVRYEAQLVARPGGETELQAVGCVAIAATPGGQQEVPMPLPCGTVVRWSEGTRGPARRLDAGEAKRLEEAANQIEHSAAALHAAYLDPHSGLDGLGRRLAKMDPSVGLDAHSLRQLARSTRPVWPRDLVFLATLADQLEQDVAKARRDAMHYNMSAAARAALQQEGGLLLIEAGYLHDLHARLSS